MSNVVSDGEEPRRSQPFMVELPLDLHMALQDEAIRRSRQSGKRVHMTDIARQALRRELAFVTPSGVTTGP